MSNKSLNSSDIAAAPLANEEMAEGEMDSETGSLASSVVASSIASTTAPDKYGFFGGAQYTKDGKESVPPEVIRKREIKWLEMFDNWDQFMLKNYKKVRSRCRKGIPSSIRARAWTYLCGANKLMEQHPPGTFERLTNVPSDPKIEDEIRKDIHRQFPQHEMFLETGHGQEDLYKVLKVHAQVSQDGYCQAQAPLAAVLLMQMPAEEAFWCLRSICDKYVPGYYAAGMVALQIDGDILNKLLKRVSLRTYKHFKKHKIEPVLYMTEWFLCLFSRTLPWTSVLRIWDMFFCEGIKVMFRVALVLLKYGLRPEVLKNCPGMYETLEALRDIHPNIKSEEFLLTQMANLDLREETLKNEHNRQVQKRITQERRKKQSGANILISTT